MSKIGEIFKTSGYELFSKGVRWDMIASLAFGVMDFGIGASATLSGWFLPVLWTRIFSICSLILISYWRRYRRMKRLHMAAIAQPHTEEAEHSAIIIEVTPSMSSTAPLGNLDGITSVDPDATVIGR